MSGTRAQAIDVASSPLPHAGQPQSTSAIGHVANNNISPWHTRRRSARPRTPAGVHTAEHKQQPGNAEELETTSLPSTSVPSTSEHPQSTPQLRIRSNPRFSIAQHAGQQAAHTSRTIDTFAPPSSGHTVPVVIDLSESPPAERAPARPNSSSVEGVAPERRSAHAQHRSPPHRAQPARKRRRVSSGEAQVVSEESGPSASTSRAVNVNVDEDERLARWLQEHESPRAATAHLAIDEEMARRLQEEEERAARPVPLWSPYMHAPESPPHLPPDLMAARDAAGPSFLPPPMPQYRHGHAGRGRGRGRGRGVMLPSGGYAHQPVFPSFMRNAFDPVFGAGTSMLQALLGGRHGGGGVSTDMWRLAATDRDFTEADYEALLALDENQAHGSGGGASQEAIDSLPTHTIKASDAKLEPCAICLDDIEVRNVVRRMPCLHAFHKKCIDKWLRRKNECPVCKARLGGG
eukprot:jgi/Chlat1/6650/Chrsp49S06124